MCIMRVSLLAIKQYPRAARGGTGTCMINTIHDSVTNAGTAQSFSIPDNICVNVFTNIDQKNT